MTSGNGRLGGSLGHDLSRIGDVLQSALRHALRHGAGRDVLRCCHPGGHGGRLTAARLAGKRRAGRHAFGRRPQRGDLQQVLRDFPRAGDEERFRIHAGPGEPHGVAAEILGHVGALEVALKANARGGVPDAAGGDVYELVAGIDEEEGLRPDLTVEDAHHVQLLVVHGDQGRRSHEEVHRALLLDVVDVQGDERALMLQAEHLGFAGEAPVHAFDGVDQLVIGIIGVVLAVVPVRVAPVGAASRRAREHLGPGEGALGRFPGRPVTGHDGHAASQQAAVEGHAQLLQPETAGVAVDEHGVAVIQAAFGVKDEVQSAHGGVIGGKTAGDGTIGDGVGVIVHHLVDDLMPDKVFLRIDARPVRQHDHKDHVFGVQAEAGILHAVEAGTVEGGDLSVFDAAFRQLFIDVGQLLQVLRAGLGCPACEQAAEQQQGQDAPRQAAGGKQTQHWAPPSRKR